MPQRGGNGSGFIGRLRAALRSPIGLPVARAYAGVATCLVYHRVMAGAASATRTRFDPNLELFVAEEEFEKQVRLIAEKYAPLSLDEAVTLLRQRRLPPRSVIVTFDDGYRDNLLALPILERYHVPAAVYVTTGAVARTRTLWWDEHESALAALTSLELHGRRWDLSTPQSKAQAFLELNRLFKAMDPAQQDDLMDRLRSRAGIDAGTSDGAMLSWDEVRRLDRHPLMTIGAHSVDHHVMTQLSEPELEHQMVMSRTELEHQLGHSIDHFAYPFGGPEHAARREFRAAERAGFASAVTTRPGHWHRSSRLHALSRIAIDFSDSIDDFEWKLSGGYAATHLPLRAASAAKSFLRAVTGRQSSDVYTPLA